MTQPHKSLGKATVKRVIQIDLQRDDCPVIHESGGSAADLKKQLAKLRRAMVNIPLGVDPAKLLRASRQQHGLV